MSGIASDVDPRAVLIRAIHDLGRRMSATAEAEALNAIRDPANKDKQATAARYVLISDTEREFANKVISLVNAHWPKTT